MYTYLSTNVISECPGNGEIGACECDGQLWINEDCRLKQNLLYLGEEKNSQPPPSGFITKDIY